MKIIIVISWKSIKRFSCYLILTISICILNFLSKASQLHVYLFGQKGYKGPSKVKVKFGGGLTLKNGLSCGHLIRLGPPISSPKNASLSRLIRSRISLIGSVPPNGDPKSSPDMIHTIAIKIQRTRRFDLFWIFLTK